MKKNFWSISQKVLRATTKTSKEKQSWKNVFYLLKFTCFLEIFFLSPEIKWGLFSEIGNNAMRALGSKKHMFFGNALPKSNARAHLKKRKNIVALLSVNPLTAGAEYIGFFTQLLPHSVPPFKNVKAIMWLQSARFENKNLNNFHSLEVVDRVSETDWIIWRLKGWTLKQLNAPMVVFAVLLVDKITDIKNEMGL